MWNACILSRKRMLCKIASSVEGVYCMTRVFLKNNFADFLDEVRVKKSIFPTAVGDIWLQQSAIIGSQMMYWRIRWRSECVMGIIAPAIGPNSSKKLTQYLQQSLNEKQYACMAYTQQVFYIQTLLQLLCEFLGTVWTYCWGDNPHYIITSPANGDRKFYR